MSLAVAIASLFFSLYVFFAHNRKLNAQQKQLNELALKKAVQEEAASKKACIFLSHVKMGTSDRLAITNKGQATAFDVRLSSEVEKDPVKMINMPPQWDSIKPGQVFNHPIPLGSGVAMRVTYDITWRDELGEHKDQQIVDYL